MISITTQAQRVSRLRELINGDDLVLMPSCYDGLTARLIERAGYDSCLMTGYGVSAVHGVPDTQLLSYGEMVRAAQIVCSSQSIPCLGDGDTGYGNAMNVKRTVAGYAQAGMAGIMLEDQVAPKRCGHTAGKAVVDRQEAFNRIKAAVDARREGNFDIVIMARTDARATHSLEEAIARCQEFVRLGADITFLEAPQSVEEMKTFCEQVPGPKLANMVEMGMTPVLLPEQLHEIGYKIALYPVTLLNASIKAMEKALVELRNQKADTTTKTVSGVNATPSVGLNELLSDFEHVKDVVGFTEYYAEEERYGATKCYIGPVTHSRVTSYYGSANCTGIPEFIYEKDVSGCEFVECQALNIGAFTNSSKVDCYQNDRGETAAIFAEVEVPYVIQEQYTPPDTCDSLVNALAFYADGMCRILPNITSYTASIATVKSDLSLQLQLFDDTKCTESVSNMSITSSQVE